LPERPIEEVAAAWQEREVILMQAELPELEISNSESESVSDYSDDGDEMEDVEVFINSDDDDDAHSMDELDIGMEG